MSSEWGEVLLGEFADINPRRTISKGTSAKFIDMAALPIYGRDIDNKDITIREFTSGGAKFRNGDTLLARITPCLENGKTALVSCLNGGEFAFGSTEFIVLGPKSVDDSLFLYYLVRSEEFRTYAISRMEGTSGRQRVPNSAVADYRFLCPPPTVRKEIGRALGNIDNRIALLRETNASLEAIAQALFKSWFVDFDPVHVNAGSQAPSLPPEIQTLFPKTFSDSPIGPLPEGWKVKQLGDVTTYLNRGISPKYVETGGVVVVNQKCIRDFAVDLSKARRHDPTQRKIDGRILETGDVLVNSTGIGTLGRVAQLLEVTETIIADSHVTAVRANSELSWPYLGLALMRKQPEIEAMGEGTTGQTELARAKLAMLPIVCPSKEVLSVFDDFVTPLKKKLAANTAMAENLSTIRDTLLPRLISGQLRLPEAELALEEFID